jgi:hypothetical protein
VVHLVVSILRVEHLVASDLWILRRGRAFQRRQNELLNTSQGRRRLEDPSERWRLYQTFGGGQLPWLFVGIQSGRLLRWSAGANGIRRLLLRLLRGGWRYYTYGPASAALAAGYLWHHQERSELDSGLLLIDMSVLAAGSVAIAAGGVLASLQMGAFARYHHFGWPPVRRNKLAAHELAFVVGSGLVAFVIMTGLILVIGVEFSGYGSFGPADPVGDQLWNSAFVAFTGIIGQGYFDPQNGFGVLGLFMVATVQLSYLVILLGVTQKTWSA